MLQLVFIKLGFACLTRQNIDIFDRKSEISVAHLERMCRIVSTLVYVYNIAMDVQQINAKCIKSLSIRFVYSREFIKRIDSSMVIN